MASKRPALPDAAMSSAMPMARRAFASALADLDIDFDGDDRPALITALLCACLDPPPPAPQVWAWTVDARLRALLALLRATLGGHASLGLRCADASCRREMEVDIDLDALIGAAAGAAPDAARWSARGVDGIELGLRLATGDDQRRWRRTRFDDDAARVIASELVERLDGCTPPPHWRLPEAWLPEVEAELAAHDPLGAVLLPMTCPWCGAEQQAAPDLEAWALAQLAAVQRRVLEQVHQLARVYHWSEAEVLAVPPRRRTWYLARSAAGIEA